LANDAVCVIPGGGGSAVFELSDIHFTLNTISVDDVYSQLLEEKIRRDGFIELPYKNYYTAFSRHTGSTRFSATSQSIDKIYTVLRAADYTTQSAAIDVSTGDVDADVVFPRKLTKYLKFEDSGIADWQYQINNVLYPQYRAKPLDASDIYK